MKRLSFLLLLISFSSVGQIAYQDAEYLEKVAGNGSSLPEEAAAVINQYYQFPFSGNALAAKLNEALKQNPFLKEYEINIGDLAGSTSLLKGLSPSSIGNLDVTNFADGLGKFLVERTKQELSTSFFERFKDDLKSIPQLQILFPQSFVALEAIDKQIYNYSAYLDLLRESFQKDITLLLPNIARLINDSSMDELFNKYPTIKTILADGFYLINQLNGGSHPGEAIHNYVHTTNSDLESIHPDLPASVQTLDLFSQSLRSTKNGEYWITREDLNLLFAGQSLRFFLGLIYQKAVNQNIKFNNTTLAAALSAMAARLDEAEKVYKPYLFGLLEKGKNVEASFITLKNALGKGNNTATYQDYYTFYNNALDLFEYLLQSPVLVKSAPTRRDNSLSQYLSTARSFGNIYVDIYEKQYSSAIVEFSVVLQRLLKDKLNAAVIADDQATSDLLKKYMKVSTLFIKYGGFAATVAKAENSDEVKDAIEAIALPAGSSRIKRETPFNVAINGYLGLFGGWEKIADVDRKAKGAFGVFAPVGISVSRGHSIFFAGTGKTGWEKNKLGWSSSLFISIIDLGALASFRFEESTRNVNDTTLSVSQVPAIKLKDIISPGVFYSLGIPKSPLSLTFGAQLGANIRKVNVLTPGNLNITNQYNDKMYWRFSISLLVDLPLLNLYTKSL